MTLLLFSLKIRSNSLWPQGLQHSRLPCPSLSLGVCSNSCPMSPVMLSNPLILCHPLHLLPSVFPSIRVFSNESALHISWPKYWSISFSTSPSSEYSGLISFRIDLFSCSPRNSQESSPTPQFETLNSLALSLLYGLTLTSTSAVRNLAPTIWHSFT